MFKELFQRRNRTLRKWLFVVLLLLLCTSFFLWAVILYSRQYTTKEEFLRLPKAVCSSFVKFIRTIDHKIRGESEVVQWLWDCPLLEGSWFIYPPETKYSSHEEWINVGRNINEVENKLISLYRRNVYPMLTDTIIYALGYLGTEKSLPLLIEILKNKEHDLSIRTEAAGALGEIGNLAAVEPMCSVVASDQEDISLRRIAIYDLDTIGDPRAIPVIEEFLRNTAQDKKHKDIIQKIIDELKEKEQNKELRDETLQNSENK